MRCSTYLLRYSGNPRIADRGVTDYFFFLTLLAMASLLRPHASVCKIGVHCFTSTGVRMLRARCTLYLWVIILLRVVYPLSWSSTLYITNDIGILQTKLSHREGHEA